MTNGEKIKEIFPNTKIITQYDNPFGDRFMVFMLNNEDMQVNMDWWNAEYKEPTTKSEALVSLGVYKQVAWERDIAIQQLHELGYEFGEKIEPTKNNLSSELEKNSKKLEKDFGELDCISRADAIKSMQEKAKRLTNEDTINGLCGAVAILFDMPSVTPQEPKTGHWISHGEHCENLGVIPSGLGAYKWCSNCDCGIDIREWHRKNYNYCPNCGAKMVESQEVRDKE